ncbi:hypothetical protein RV05_GL002043 [Enterococcus hirae]|nr:hypothetical protein RV05_GL002043 [Enterococcus hirae]
MLENVAILLACTEEHLYKSSKYVLYIFLWLNNFSRNG